MDENHDTMFTYSPNDRSHHGEHFAPIYRSIPSLFMNNMLENDAK